MLLVQTAKENWEDVALIEPAATYQFDCGIAKVVGAPLMVHAKDFRGIQKALHVLAETKNRRTAFGRVTTNSFKDAGAVVQDVRHHVHARVIPFDEFAVMPNDITNARRTNVLLLVAH